MSNWMTPPKQGWVCPNCGNVYAPWMPECTKCNAGYSPATTGGSFPIGPADIDPDGNPLPEPPEVPHE